MENRFRDTLTAKVDPIFFAFCCLLLILLLLSAMARIQDIMNTSDDGAEMLRLARVSARASPAFFSRGPGAKQVRTGPAPLY